MLNEPAINPRNMAFAHAEPTRILMTRAQNQLVGAQQQRVVIVMALVPRQHCLGQAKVSEFKRLASARRRKRPSLHGIALHATQDGLIHQVAARELGWIVDGLQVGPGLRCRGPGVLRGPVEIV